MAPEATRLRVKFQGKGQRAGDAGRWLRQFPGGTPRWERCEFLFDPEATRYDWLVVYDDLAPVGGERFSSRRERLACAPEHTLLVTAEPSSVKCYGRAFTAQFGHVLTSQEPWALPHPGAVRSQTGYRWFYGAGGPQPRCFDTLVAAPPPAKAPAIATLCSSKAHGHTLHARRVAFTEALAGHLPELQRFGRGVRPVADKAEAIDGYGLHLAIENHRAPHHFTEKLADAFLGRALPVYHGAPDAADYFPPESFLAIGLEDPGAVAETIRAALRERPWERHAAAIEEARRRVLHEYNLFAVLARFVEEHHAPERRPTGASVKSRHRARRQPPWALVPDALERRRVRRRAAREQGGGPTQRPSGGD